MEKKQNIFNRVLQFIDSKGISKNEFSNQIGLSNSYLSKMGKENASIGSLIIQKILRIYPELNVDWLITGNGEMIKTSQKTSLDECEILRMDIARYQKDISRYLQEIELFLEIVKRLK